MSDGSLNMVAPPQTYRERRARLAAGLPRPLLLLAGRSRARHYATNTHPFRAGSSYLYFGGPPLEGAAWLIEPGSDGEAGCALLRATAGFEDAVWTGEPPSDEVISASAGVPQAALFPPDSLEALLASHTACWVAPPCPPTMDWIASLGLEPADPDELLAIIELRLIKDEHELVAMRRAAEAGVQAHLAAMKDGIDPPTVVRHVEPVSYLLAFTVHGQLLPRQGVANHERNELLGELIRSIVV